MYELLGRRRGRSVVSWGIGRCSLADVRAGFFCVDKPVGLSSRHVVDVVGRAVGCKRIGHCGTLDPMASGVLVIAVGKATQLVEYIQRMPKTYLAEFELGATSDTDDATGTVARNACPLIAAADIEFELAGFVGEILQRPPAYSAIKVAGQRAYRKARAGENVLLAPRKVVVHSIDQVRVAFPRVSCQIVCGSGVYVRSIGRDLGARLGVGALMTSLCRTAIGEFRVESAAPLGIFDEPASWPRYWLCVDAGLTDLPNVTLDLPAELRFRNGQRVALPFNEAADAVAVWDSAKRLLGIGRVGMGGELRPVKGGFAPLERNEE